MMLMQNVVAVGSVVNVVSGSEDTRNRKIVLGNPSLSPTVPKSTLSCWELLPKTEVSFSTPRSFRADKAFPLAAHSNHNDTFLACGKRRANEVLFSASIFFP